MVAYSFKPGFIPKIQALEKRQTIRLPRKRHARAGEDLQLFTGPRMRPVRIGSAVCQGVQLVRLDFASDVVTLDDAIELSAVEELDAFATRDGFGATALTEAAGLTPWAYMGRWWALTHPGQELFAGVLVDWGESFIPTVTP